MNTIKSGIENPAERMESLTEKIITLAIEEDVAEGDITTNALISGRSMAVAEMKAKAPGVISGL
ncbi:MAG: hypothetical protein M0P27_07350, partial [Bacteroidales bacterium]|nr:hypothetical protein [Bacteroidales bacterium]